MTMTAMHATSATTAPMIALAGGFFERRDMSSPRKRASRTKVALGSFYGSGLVLFSSRSMGASLQVVRIRVSPPTLAHFRAGCG